MNRQERVEISKRLSVYLTRKNQNDLKKLCYELSNIGFSSDIVFTLQNRDLYGNFTDSQILAVLYVCDKIFHTTFFKTVMGYSYEEASPSIITSLFKNNKTLNIYQYQKLYNNIYFGATTLNEFYESLVGDSPLIKSIINLTDIQDLKQFSMVDVENICPLIIYSDNIHIVDSELLEVGNGTISSDALYFYLATRKSISNGNTQIPVYITSKPCYKKDQYDKRTPSYYAFVNCIKHNIINDINKIAGYDIITDINKLRKKSNIKTSIIIELYNIIKVYFDMYDEIILYLAKKLQDILDEGVYKLTPSKLEDSIKDNVLYKNDEE